MHRDPEYTKGDGPPKQGVYPYVSLPPPRVGFISYTLGGLGRVYLTGVRLDRIYDIRYIYICKDRGGGVERGGGGKGRWADVLYLGKMRVSVGKF